MPTQRELALIVRAIPGVTAADVETLKPGVVRVRVVGGKRDYVRKVLEQVKGAGSSVVVEHRDDPAGAVTEIFL